MYLDRQELHTPLGIEICLAIAQHLPDLVAYAMSLWMVGLGTQTSHANDLSGRAGIHHLLVLGRSRVQTQVDLSLTDWPILADR